MTYELAKQLKDAGFEIKDFTKHWYWGFDEDGFEQRYLFIDSSLTDKDFKVFDYPFEPTLAELIEALGNDFYQLEKIPTKLWIARGTNDGELYREEGETPEEAVARLYLALNSKNNA